MASVKSTQIVIDSRSTKVNVSEIHLLACLWVLNELGQLKEQDALRKLSGEVYHKDEDTNIRNLLKALETIGAISLTTDPLRIQINENAKVVLDQAKLKPEIWEETKVKNRRLLKALFLHLEIKLPSKKNHYLSLSRLLFVSLAAFQIMFEITFLLGKAPTQMDSIFKLIVSGILLVLFLLPRISVVNYKDKDSF